MKNINSEPKPKATKPEVRSNFILLAAGKRFSGKTTIVMAFAKASGKRIIVINTDSHPAYKDFETINVEQLKTWDGQNCQVICDEALDIQNCAIVLNKYQANAFVIFEDPQKYIGNTVERPFKNLVINHRMRNFDLCFMYHLLKFVPPYIASNVNCLILFKTTDIYNSTLSAKYQNIEAIERSANRVNSNPDIHYCEVIFDDEK